MPGSQTVFFTMVSACQVRHSSASIFSSRPPWASNLSLASQMSLRYLPEASKNHCLGSRAGVIHIYTSQNRFISRGSGGFDSGPVVGTGCRAASGPPDLLKYQYKIAVTCKNYMFLNIF